MGASKMCKLEAVVTVVMALTMAGLGEAQTTASCANNLVPCASYFNATSPPASCCNPLKETIENDRECLCNLYNNPSLLESFHINITQALELPKHCGISDSISCNASTPSPTGSPPATPGNDDNGASIVAGTGISCLLLLFASLML